MKSKLLLFAALITVIFSSCYDPYYYDYVDASFYTKDTEYLVGEEIQFYNTSDEAQSYLWDFGDGQTSTLINPRHTYSEAGLYEVKLNAYGHDGKDEAYAPITITSSFEPTKLNILVKFYQLSNPMEGCNVYLYDNLDSYNAFTDAIADAVTGSDGIVEFTGLNAQIYYIDAFFGITDTTAYTNQFTDGIATDVLEENTTNYYDVEVQFVTYSSGETGYIVKSIKKSSEIERKMSIQ